MGIHACQVRVTFEPLFHRASEPPKTPVSSSGWAHSSGSQKEVHTDLALLIVKKDMRLLYDCLFKEYIERTIYPPCEIHLYYL